MKTKKSPLQIDNINITGCQLMTIMPNNDNEPLNNYDINMDFDTFSNEGLENDMIVFLRVEGNDIENPVSGYCFSIISEASISFSKDIKEKDKSALISISALQIIVSYVRGYIANITAYCPFGQYILPAIDLNDLIKQKKELINNQNKKED